MSNTDIPADLISPTLDYIHHDRPERHYFGQSLGIPIAPPVISSLPSTASAGVSDTPAREDHVHGIPAYILPGTVVQSLTAATRINTGAGTLTSDASGNLTFNWATPFPTACDGVAFLCSSSTSILNSGILIASGVNRFGLTIALRNSSTGANPGAGIGVGIWVIAAGH